jgi:Na+(H+)/acetate symporter ActP
MSSILMSAYWKIPLQALVLLIGVLIFVYHLFDPHPLLLNPAHDRAVRQAQPTQLAALEARYQTATAARSDAARSGNTEALRTTNAETNAVRAEALALATEVTGQPSRDVNYIMPRFVLMMLPLGFAGVFIAAVMAAAMSSIAAELNSLSTATVIDFYRRWFRREASDSHYLAVSKVATVIWGILACGVATFAVSLGSLIEVVNRFGSFFYGSILGVFLLAMIPAGRATGAFFGLIAGMAAVAWVSFSMPAVSFLWHNVIGAVVVVAVGLLLSGRSRPASEPSG